MTLHVTHIDTCLPCYLQDHHTRDGEALIGISVDSRNIKDDLLTEATLCEAIPEHFTEDMILAAINAEFGGTVIEEDDLWDDKLEVLADNGVDVDDEPPQAWFLFQWDLRHV